MTDRSDDVIPSLLRRGALLGALTLVLAACGSEAPDPPRASTGTSSSAPPPASNAVAQPDQPFGPACSDLPADGESSIAGMVDDPVATAAADNPALSTLAQAIAAAGLVDSFDSQQGITVLAPVNAAFEAVSPDALQALLADTPQLTALLTHHVVAGRLAPDQLAGTHTTLNNDQLTIERAGETWTIPGEGTVTSTEATVVCGNVPTANATVYFVDQVLSPPAA